MAPAKRTALNVICGFYRPDAGTVTLGDQNRIGAARSPDSARRDRAHLSDQSTVRDDVGDRQRLDRAAARQAWRRIRFPASECDAESAEIAESLLAFVGYAGAHRSARGRAVARRQAAGRNCTGARASPRRTWRSTSRLPDWTRKTPPRSAPCCASLPTSASPSSWSSMTWNLVMGVSEPRHRARCRRQDRRRAAGSGGRRSRRARSLSRRGRAN